MRWHTKIALALTVILLWLVAAARLLDLVSQEDPFSVLFGFLGLFVLGFVTPLLISVLNKQLSK